ncbi:hypothetical protein BT67DRAFT_433312 [Trichocladium antarcticum]|uniref:Heterokaryon incompatibility domain-containing protein n=1 Tax=Trichocladium antarcticum TaxID=1450529 RepID=A0AAN6ZEA6_9PEZI|nr:hypothetical protein BT67DRAFT_433312 [Trichocladium antarcticum]
MVPRSTDSADAMRLMLLSNMLMAFRGEPSQFSRSASFPALTSGGYESDGSDDERNYRAVVPSPSPHALERKTGYSKIAYACRQAERDGYHYVWVDTCCIDKRSSAEMSEAINSMFSWYQQAAVCYAYLEDVHFDDYTEGYRTWQDQFGHSRWFARGWTLQELLAPRKVVFYAKGWRLLGTKSSLVKTIAKAARIDELTLLEPNLIRSASIAQRMSWAANRTTTRREDVAYSLLGILGVNMPILYGEGENAFLRLQEEIIKRSDDQSLFAWGILNHHRNTPLPHDADTDTDTDFDYESLTGSTPILAASPLAFAGMEHVVAASPSTSAQPAADYTMTNKGLHITLPLIPHPTNTTQHLAILACHLATDPTARLTIPLTIPLTAAGPTPNILLRSTPSPTPTPTPTPTASATDLAAAKPRTVYIPNAPAQIPRARRRRDDEILLFRASDLLAPGYAMIDVRGTDVCWDGRATGAGAGAGVGAGVGVGVGVHGRGVGGDGAGAELVAEAARVWEAPGSVEVGVVGGGDGGRAVRVDVVKPAAEGGGLGEERGVRGWAVRPGYEVKVFGHVTFAEKWEKEYQRTVQATVERKKNGVIELRLSSMLWQAAPVVQSAEELDQPS